MLRGKEKAVLVMDDNYLFQCILKKALSQDGFDIYQAENGIQGLKLMDKIDFPIIVVDLFMPEMDGFAFLKEINPGPSDSYEIIVTTGHSDSQTVKKCFSYGICHFLVKPLDFVHVRELVKNLYARTKHREKDLRVRRERLKAMERKIACLEKSTLK